jgi:hypothetical protein
MKSHRIICLTEMSDQGVRFLAEIRRAGMDVLFPQIKHDKVRISSGKRTIADSTTLAESTIHLALINHYTTTNHTLYFIINY